MLLASALIDWLVADLAGAAWRGGRRVLLGSRDQQALRALAHDTVRTLVAELPNVDDDQRQHLTAVLLERGDPGRDVAVTSEAELRVALLHWVQNLDEPVAGGVGYLSGLGLRADRVADDIASSLLAGIRREARAGRALVTVETWLWRDEISIRLGRLEAQTPALAPATSPPTLPAGTERFVGRQGVLAELRPQTNDVTVFAITGMAGIGKTSVAVKAAQQNLDRFPDGVYFLDLGSHTAGQDPTAPVDALAELLRQGPAAAGELPPGLAARQAAWRRQLAGRRTIVILDDARDSQQVRPLLPAVAGCLVLVTSRSRMAGLTEARPLPLSTLSTPEAAELLVALAGVDEQADLTPVDDIVGATGRLPLAVRIVAGRLRANPGASLALVAAELHDYRRRLDELSPEDAGVRAAFASSVTPLAPPLRRAFMAGGLNPGTSLTPPVLSALADCPADDAATMLRGLADQNLLDLMGGDRPRYEAHELVREYARELAETTFDAGEQAAALDRLTRHYRQLVAGDDWREVAAERENLVAFARAAAGDDAVDTAAEVGQRLFRIDEYRAAAAVFEAVQAHHSRSGDRRRQAETHNQLGRAVRLSGDYPGAREHFERALELSEATGDRSAWADAQFGLGRVARMYLETPVVKKHFELAQEVYTTLNDRRGIAEVLHGLAELRGQERATKRVLLQRALDICLEIGDDAHRGTIIEHFAGFALADGRCDEAEALADEALNLVRAAGNRRSEADTLRLLGDIAGYRGDVNAPRQYYETALELYRDIGHRLGEVRVLKDLAAAASKRGDHARAQARFGEILGVELQVAWQSEAALAHLQLGRMAHEDDDRADARAHYQAALALTNERRSDDTFVLSHYWLGHVAVAEGDQQAAREHFTTAAELFDGPANRGLSLYYLAAAARDSGDFTEASARFEQSAAAYREVERFDSAGLALLKLGIMDKDTGNDAAADHHLTAALALLTTSQDRALGFYRLGQIKHGTGDLGAAQTCFENALTLYTELDDRLLRGHTLWLLGIVHRDAGDLSAATARLTEALDFEDRFADRAAIHDILARVADDRDALIEVVEQRRAEADAWTAAGDRAEEAEARARLGHALYYTGETRAAHKELQATLELRDALKEGHWAAYAMFGLARIAARRGDLGAAHDFYRRALETYDEEEHQLGRANVLVDLGELALDSGHPADAESSYRRARDLAEKANSRLPRANAITGLGNVAVATGNLTDASRWFAEALDLYLDFNSALGIGNVRYGQGDSALADRDLAAAATYYSAALERYTAVGVPVGRAEAHLGLGDVARQHGDSVTATGRYTEALEVFRHIEDARGEARARKRLEELRAEGRRPDPDAGH